VELKLKMIVNNFLSLDIELKILILFFVLVIVYSLITGIVKNVKDNKKITREEDTKKRTSVK
jgi:uncharacterized membrane protein